VNLPYSIRLLFLCLAAFFLVNLFAGLMVAALTNYAGRLAKWMPSRAGARFLLALRMAPVTMGCCVVGGLCVPSYLWMEPEAGYEPVGWVCLLAAALAVAGGLLSGARAIRALVRSRRFLRQSFASPRTLSVGGQQFEVGIIESREPIFALAGIVRPQLIVAEQSMDAFPSEELASALRHEQAHGDSHDNLKRFLMLLAPDVLPFVYALRPLEHLWMELAEWAADDRASAGNPGRSLTLASALVRAARISVLPDPPPDLVTALLANGQDLSIRVDRLLGTPAASEGAPRVMAFLAGTAVLIACGIPFMMRPATFSFAHGLLEHLIR
jgi:hypothetical protein